MSIYDSLNDRQKEAVFQTEGPVLILAGAGSGKTRVIIHRIAYLMEQCNVNPYNIMAITFTNKAAGEMRERVNQMVGFGAESIWVSTFHSSCVRILRRYIDRLGFSDHFTIYDSDDSKAVMKEVCKKLKIDTKQVKEKTILNAISAAKNELIGPTEFAMKAISDFSQKRISDAYIEYQDMLKKSNALDFDDLIVKTVELFRSCPDVLEGYQKRFRYIMVDEYQDTNTAQFELIRLLSGGSRNLCVVGDDDQSIYKFRGANIRNILDFEKVFSDAKVIKLEQNYRSTQNILDAANAVIAHNSARKSKALWTDAGEGNPIHFKTFETAKEEAQFIVEDINRRCRNDRQDYGDFAILYRTNAQARLLEESFVLDGTPYEVVGGTNFYARREIKDMLAYLKTIDNGMDDLACRRIINVPRRGIGATTIERVQEYAIAHGMSFYDALLGASGIPGLGRSAAKLDSFVTLIQGFRGKMEYYSLKELMQDIIDMTGYVDELRASEDEEDEDRIENIEELISKITTYEESAEEPTLNGFLEEVALVADIDSLKEDDNHVVLMTLHSAKGLEFKNVYLAGMEDGVFPSYMSITSNDPTDVEEERRLAYVGITRAKEDLTLCYAKMRMIRGETQMNPVSRYVREIPEKLIDGRVPPAGRRVYDDDDDYSDSYSARSSAYGSGSYGSSAYGGGSSAYGGGYEPAGGRNLRQVSYKSLGTSPMQNAPYGGSYSTGSSGSSTSGTGRSAYGFRGLPITRPQRTPDEKKPFIAQNAKPLSSIQGLSKGMPKLQMLDSLSYEVGDRVTHAKFGEGLVKEIVKDPRDYKVTVEFDTAGVRVMYASFARLEKVEES
ncbi:MAG: UvrD-helicase domain-containing protein [Lachnospiraceae bacterium]|nr:UvrD-helicase domain-containing protein [Lachnospiraceae bacterium]